jgi:hypothetical protein
MCQWTRDRGQRSSLIIRDTVVCRLASKGAAKTDPTKMAPKDMEGNPVPNYLQYVKSAKGGEKIIVFFLMHEILVLLCYIPDWEGHKYTQDSYFAVNIGTEPRSIYIHSSTK